MKYGVLLVVVGVLFSAGCGSKKIYDEGGYLFNPTGVWSDFKYDHYGSYGESAAALRARLKEVWHIRHALGRYTKATTKDVSEIIGELVPSDGSPTGKDCKGDSKGVVLLLHGLYDSPYVMKDVGRFFNEKCYQSRFLLLPGHGTVPGDLRSLEFTQWADAVEAVVKQTKVEFKEEEIIIAGFSTGAGLALNYASDHRDDVQALFLFAPLVNLSVKPVFGAGLIEALGEYVQKSEEMDSFKYESVPAYSVLQANQLAKMVKNKLRKNNLEIPVFIAQAKNDNTLPSEATIDLFNDNAFGADSVFLLYSPVEADGFRFSNCDNIEQDVFSNTNKVTCNSSFTYTQDGFEATIDDYSHMSLVLSPTDPHYGINGKYRYCLHYRKGTNLKICRTGLKPDVCYGERDVFRGRHVSEACPVFKSVMIRLTSNPKLQHLKSQLAHFMRKHEL
jgi:alpha-beta hydrolase superfamily lysophospholipase